FFLGGCNETSCMDSPRLYPRRHGSHRRRGGGEIHSSAFPRRGNTRRFLIARTWTPSSLPCPIIGIARFLRTRARPARTFIVRSRLRLCATSASRNKIGRAHV